MVLAPTAAASPGDITTIAGTGAPGSGGDGAAATAAQLTGPTGVSPTADGGYLIADYQNNRIRKISSGGTITTVAGTGTAGFSGDGGAATAAMLAAPVAVTALSDGSFLIADSANNRIRKVSTAGVITTIAGTGAAGSTGDGGAATAARITGPTGVYPTADGGYLVADYKNNRVRKVSSGGTITTVAGTGTAGFSGDGGAATAAMLDAPVSVAATLDGGFLVTDSANNRVRKVSSGGTITTIAGTGTAGFGGDGGAAGAAQLNAPVGVQPTPDGGFLVADMVNNRVRAVSAGGTISTVAGTGAAALGADGIAATASDLNAPVGVALAATGAILIADTTNNRVRSVEPAGAPAAEEPVVTVTPTASDSSVPAVTEPSSDPPPLNIAPIAVLTPVKLVLPKGGVTVTPSGAVPLQIGCPADAAARCEGTVTLQISVRSARASTSRRGRGKLLTIARAKFSVAPGGKTTVKVHLSRRGRNLLASKGGLKVTAKITRRGGPTLDQKTQTAAIKIKPRKPRRAKRASAR